MSLANNIHFPCKYRNDGCLFTSMLGDKPEHELNCDSRPFSCIFAECYDLVTPSKIEDHFISVHHLIPLAGRKHEKKDKFLFSLPLNSSPKEVVLLHIPEWGHFIARLHHIADENCMWIFIYAVLSQPKSQRFLYKMKVHTDDTTRSSCLAPVQSLHDFPEHERRLYVDSPNWVTIQILKRNST